VVVAGGAVVVVAIGALVVVVAGSPLQLTAAIIPTVRIAMSNRLTNLEFKVSPPDKLSYLNTPWQLSLQSRNERTKLKTRYIKIGQHCRYVFNYITEQIITWQRYGFKYITVENLKFILTADRPSDTIYIGVLRITANSPDRDISIYNM
jgi:hypothetical protein